MLAITILIAEKSPIAPRLAGSCPTPEFGSGEAKLSMSRWDPGFESLLCCTTMTDSFPRDLDLSKPPYLAMHSLPEEPRRSFLFQQSIRKEYGQHSVFHVH
jgi:hypothetical protein